MVYGQNPTQPTGGAVQRFGFHDFCGFHGLIAMQPRNGATRDGVATGTLHKRWKQKLEGAREMKPARRSHKIELRILNWSTGILARLLRIYEGGMQKTGFSHFAQSPAASPRGHHGGRWEVEVPSRDGRPLPCRPRAAPRLSGRR